MKNSYEICNANWNKDFGERIVEEYEYVKQVYLEAESEDEKEKKLLNQINEIVNNEKYINSEEFKKDLKQNKIFKFNNDADFVIRRLIFSIKKENTICIKNCVIQFFLKEENETFNNLNNFTNKAQIGKINIKFGEYKWHDEIRNNCVETVKELLNLDIKESVLEDFFKEKNVVYSKEIKLDQIHNLKEVSKKFPHIQGILLLLIVPNNLGIAVITKAITDISSFLGAKENTDLLYEIKIEENCKEATIKSIVAV